MELFDRTGIHCLVDGQFGSTGKGALGAWLAEQAWGLKDFNFAGVITNAGPNSGHTCYFEDKKIVLKQLPTFAVYLMERGLGLPVHLSAGAIIDPAILAAEAEEYYPLPIFVHPNAAVVSDSDKENEQSGSIAAVAGTRSGTGAALARKIQRDPSAIAKNALPPMPQNVMIENRRLNAEKYAYFMEMSQGFSLGINSHFYPKVTSRECTVMQGLADARIAPRHLKRTYMAIRTYPIRVGNVDGFSSGEWYPDQTELSWEEIGVKPELTTVTQRVRRVADFSMHQFVDSCRANDPDFVFVSHTDYCSDAELDQLLGAIRSVGDAVNEKTFELILGNGPKVSDIERCG